ncbi:MAG: hypothetical protein QXF87_07730 [Thermofilaceae archaeon]
MKEDALLSAELLGARAMMPKPNYYGSFALRARPCLRTSFPEVLAHDVYVALKRAILPRIAAWSEITRVRLTGSR